MNNLIMFPSAKTQLYNNPVKINKELINEIVCLVCDKLSMTKEQEKNLNKRVKIYEEIKELLPPGKRKLLSKYEELQLREADTVLEEAITFMIKNEKEILDTLVNY